jgi:predicted transposase YbfD/YdcC
LRRIFPPVNQRQHEQHLDVAETSGKGHGRQERRRLQASTRLAGQLAWPGLAQVCRLDRTTRRHGNWVTEIEYAITSVPRSSAGAAQLLAWWRGHWGIENRSHYVRDVTLQEDACRIRNGQAPQNFAALRNVAIALLRLHGHTNLAAAFRACAWKTQRLLAMLGIFKK